MNNKNIPRLFSLLASLATSIVFAQTPAAVPENTGTNASITRRASGVYRYETIKDQRQRGEERWQLTVHPDGSRTVMIWNDLAARNAQISVLLHVAQNFRPLEAFASYWNGGAFKGSAHILVSGTTLKIHSAGAYGERDETVSVPEEFSIGTHPVIGDGWHSWPASVSTPGKHDSTLYVLEASADLTKPVLGTLMPMQIEVLGPEILKVPAGRFQTVHLRLQGVNDLWITPIDRLVIKSVIPARDLQYVLVEASKGLR